MQAAVVRGAVAALLLAVTVGAAGAEPETPAPLPAAPREQALQALGADLFDDVNLSRDRTQSCSTCHVPDAGFVDARILPATGGAVSLGDDGRSIGTRNAPSAAYARFSPRFHRRADGRYVGGQFLDGRAADLTEQAMGPPLNPVEMGLPDKATAVARLRESPDYETRFRALFAEDIFDDHERAFEAMASAIAAFEKTDAFAPFDSRYDRYLRGEEELTDQEELGRVLFFSAQFTNCSLCHRLNRQAADPRETFTDYSFHNIGVPANPTLDAASGGPLADRGLAANPAIADKASVAGMFRVPSLRNVAVTGPYMHNGVFGDLRTVIAFYNKYNSKLEKRQINPETGQRWGAPEVDANLSTKELETGPALNDKRIDALVAFLKTLTDRRYEPLLAQQPGDAPAAGNAASP